MLLFELIQISLGVRDRLSAALTKAEWESLYNELVKQSVVGLGFEGVQKLPKEQWPNQEIILNLIAACEQIKKQNILLNNRSAEIGAFFKKAGFRYCILKGQGNALIYPNPYSRTSGDIDIWVDGDRKRIRDFVVSIAPYAEDGDMHISFPVFTDAMVEVHYKPRYMNTPKYDKRLMAFFNEHKNEQFEHIVE